MRAAVRRALRVGTGIPVVRHTVPEARSAVAVVVVVDIRGVGDFSLELRVSKKFRV